MQYNYMFLTTPYKVIPFSKQHKKPKNHSNNTWRIFDANKISEARSVCNILLYYMTVSHKDWELPNTRI